MGLQNWNMQMPFALLIGAKVHFLFKIIPIFDEKCSLTTTALSFKIVLHLGEYCYFIADIGSSLFSDFMISPYEV